MRSFMQAIIITFTLIAVGVGGFYGYLKLKQYQADQFSHANNQAPIYIVLEPIYQAMFRNGHVYQTRQYVIQLETRPGDPYKLAKANVPRIRDMIIAVLNSLSTRTGPQSLDNIEYVRGEILQKISTDLRPGVVFNLAFMGISTEPPLE
ncbi:MAG: hypothetical protein QM537_06855 [Candidatus Symbiobacter sp.]|nr:hypothetical protein [Candidatus Symbiobacter sp.]